MEKTATETDTEATTKGYMARNKAAQSHTQSSKASLTVSDCMNLCATEDHDRAEEHNDRGKNNNEGGHERKESRPNKFADLEKYPEWALERLNSLPLANAKRDGNGDKLGKGKQVHSSKTFSSCASACLCM